MSTYLKPVFVAAVIALSAFASAAGAKPAPQTCGGIAQVTCPTGQYCYYKPGICGRVADATGVCRVKPQVCPQVYLPVCGCDGKTYSNSSCASVAGVSVLHIGRCAKPKS